ncbi:MAG: DNA adenine methylase [Deltaproteobacteria bacterium]|nr:DNA adenine methylase [Deltaproteobacteria bacterium]
METVSNIVETTNFPSTRYAGSKRKIVDWIWDSVSFLDFEKVGDLFGGTAVVSNMFKRMNKSLIYNDILMSNYHCGVALIENDTEQLSDEDVSLTLTNNPDKQNKVSQLFKDVFFTDSENDFIDNYICNVNQHFRNHKYKYSMLLWCLFQACIIKRPFNLFHRKNLYMRFSNVERSFGNKVTWDRPFEEYIDKFRQEINAAVFSNGKYCKSLNLNVFELQNDFDLVYIDTPYIPQKGAPVDYRDFYHFLEGLCIYDEWEDHIDNDRKHRPLRKTENPWNSKDTIHKAFEDLIYQFRKSHLAISYRSDGIPAIEELYKIIKQFKKNVRILYFGDYKYVLSHNGNSQEVLIIGYD